MILTPKAFKEKVSSGLHNIKDITKDDLSSSEFKEYLNNVKKYILVPLHKRKSSKFVQEKIMLDEKHD